MELAMDGRDIWPSNFNGKEVIMSTTAEVHRLDVQSGGRQYVIYEFTHVPSGHKWRSGTHRMDPGVDAPSFGATLTVGQESRQFLAEREFAYNIAVSGGDPDLETWNLNTLADIRKYTYRRIFNYMKDENEDDARGAAIVALSEPTSYLNKHNNPSIAGFIDDPDWTTSTVNGAKSAISAAGVNLGQLDHGEALLDLDF